MKVFFFSIVTKNFIGSCVLSLLMFVLEDNSSVKCSSQSDSVSSMVIFTPHKKRPCVE